MSRYEIAMRATGKHDAPKGTGRTFRSRREAERSATFWNRSYALDSVRAAAVVVPAGSVTRDPYWVRVVRRHGKRAI